MFACYRRKCVNPVFWVFVMVLTSPPAPFNSTHALRISVAHVRTINVCRLRRPDFDNKQQRSICKQLSSKAKKLPISNASEVQLCTFDLVCCSSQAEGLNINTALCDPSGSSSNTAAPGNTPNKRMFPCPQVSFGWENPFRIDSI